MTCEYLYEDRFLRDLMTLNLSFMKVAVMLQIKIKFSLQLWYNIICSKFNRTLSVHRSESWKKQMTAHGENSVMSLLCLVFVHHVGKVDTSVICRNGPNIADNGSSHSSYRKKTLLIPEGVCMPSNFLADVIYCECTYSCSHGYSIRNAKWEGHLERTMS